MSPPYRWIAFAACVVGPVACHHDQQERNALARYQALSTVAAAAGCDLKITDASEATCQVWLGPCNCTLDVEADGNFGPEADGISDGIGRLEIHLSDCISGHGMDRVIAMLEPLLPESEREGLRAVVAAPPRNSPLDSISIVGTHLAPLAIAVMWSPAQWSEVSDTPVNRAYAEQTVSISVYPTTEVAGPTVVKPESQRVDAWHPTACQDGATRPWERVDIGSDSAR